LRHSVTDLRARLSAARAQAVPRELAMATVALDRIRPGAPEIPQLLADALAALERASGMMKGIPESSDAFRESRELMERLFARQSKAEAAQVAGKDVGGFQRLAEAYRQRGLESRARTLLPTPPGAPSQPGQTPLKGKP
jgi:hypothetical protein